MKSIYYLLLLILLFSCCAGKHSKISHSREMSLEEAVSFHLQNQEDIEGYSFEPMGNTDEIYVGIILRHVPERDSIYIISANAPMLNYKTYFQFLGFSKKDNTIMCIVGNEGESWPNLSQLMGGLPYYDSVDDYENSIQTSPKDLCIQKLRVTIGCVEEDKIIQIKDVTRSLSIYD